MKLASHALLGTNTEKLDVFTARFFTTLLGKAGFYVTEDRTTTTRTFALHKTPPTMVYTPDSDATRAREDEAGQAFEGTHELSPLDRQRDTAGLTYSEGEET